MKSRKEKKTALQSDVQVEKTLSPTQVITVIKWRIPKRVIFATILITIAIWFLLPILFPSWYMINWDLSFLPFDVNIFNSIPLNSQTIELITNITSYLRPFQHEERVTPGSLLLKLGAKAHFPVLMIPGITSTGLELWSGHPCAKDYFRKRLWGTLTMFRFLLIDRQCWIKHLLLDPITGMDPEGIKLRAAQGLEAADFILPGFWVWGKIIENLAEIGYDHDNLQMAPYDWRLSYQNMEKRDHYFSKLKSTIEISVAIHKKKMVVITHSMGAQVYFYFIKWVESAKGGNGGSSWINDHIHAIVNIGGSILGAPKTISSLVSGESRETAQLGTLEAYFLELFFSKEQRRNLFRSWGSLKSILPKGGNAIWGNSTILSFPESTNYPNCTSDTMTNFFKLFLPSDEYSHLLENYSFGIAKDPSNDKYDEPLYWTNPLESALPNAPDLKIVCAYGIGKPTEKAYYYKENPDSLNGSNGSISFIIDTLVNDPSQKIDFGIAHFDGDGTVPIISSGFMPYKGWKMKKFNPYNVATYTREYSHEPVSFVKDVRGGPKTSDHVDILGNHKLTEDILLIASNFQVEEVYTDKILSTLKEDLEKINL